MNIPNILTIIRLLLVPIVIYCFIIGDILCAAIFFIIACATDILDGFIARRFNMITNIGKVIDPLADKLMTASVLICLGMIGRIDFWVIAIFFIKDLLMIIGGSFAYKKGVIVGSNWAGKLATTIIWSFIIAMFFFFEIIPENIRMFIEGFSVAVALFAMLYYSIPFFKTFFTPVYIFFINLYDRIINKS